MFIGRRTINGGEVRVVQEGKSFSEKFSLFLFSQVTSSPFLSNEMYAFNQVHLLKHFVYSTTVVLAVDFLLQE